MLLSSRKLKKLTKILTRGYIFLSDKVKCLTRLFPVPNNYNISKLKLVPDKIRIVYETTRLGLNIAVWAPCFPMPSVVSHLRLIIAGTFISNCDVGEIFSTLCWY